VAILSGIEGRVAAAALRPSPAKEAATVSGFFELSSPNVAVKDLDTGRARRGAAVRRAVRFALLGTSLAAVGAGCGINSGGSSSGPTVISQSGNCPQIHDALVEIENTAHLLSLTQWNSPLNSLPSVFAPFRQQLITDGADPSLSPGVNYTNFLKPFGHC
jgi:hypothetical protein